MGDERALEPQPLSQEDKQRKPWKPRTIGIYREAQNGLIGEGTYGSVFLAYDPKNEVVALKKIRKEKKEGFPITAIREIKILKTLDHPNIVKLKDVVSSQQVEDGEVFMVFEFCNHDLTGLMESGAHITAPQIKYYFKCILEGLNYCHSMKIFHRDIKGANVLISNNGEVKLADFGLARVANSPEYTNRVVTLWYRPPELLIGDTKYTSKIDMWSAGCLFAEMLDGGKPLFPGNNTDLDQLNKIFEICGTPTEKEWAGVRTLRVEPRYRPRTLKERFKKSSSPPSPEALDLLDKLLVVNPAQRLSAAKALQHPYFTVESPPPITPEEHPLYKQNFHEYHSARRKQRRQREQERIQAERAKKQKLALGIEISPSNPTPRTSTGSSTGSSSLPPKPRPESRNLLAGAGAAASRLYPSFNASVHLPPPQLLRKQKLQS